MAEKRKSKSKKQEVDGDKPTKEEYAVAKHLRFNVPIKEARLVGMTVNCFIASEAVNCLLDSKWAKDKESLFTTRASCVRYCDELLRKGLFHRAERVVRKKKKKKPEEEEDTNGEEDGRKSKKEKKGKKKKADESEEGEKKEEKSEEKKEEKEKKDEKKDKEKKEKKLKLDMHPDQQFLDGDEVYVWIYDPVNTKTFIIGLLMVLGVIGICLFPLWPPEVRVGVYYLSLGAAGLIGVLLGLIVVKFILYVAIWAGTFGKHHFWLFPNLTEDVGFFESFVPLYSHEEKSADGKKDDKSKKDKKSDSKKKSSKKGKAKDSDAEVEEPAGKASESALGEGASGEGTNKEKESSEESNGGFEMVDGVPVEGGE